MGVERSYMQREYEANKEHNVSKIRTTEERQSLRSPFLSWEEESITARDTGGTVGLRSHLGIFWSFSWSDVIKGV